MNTYSTTETLGKTKFFPESRKLLCENISVLINIHWLSKKTMHADIHLKLNRFQIGYTSARVKVCKTTSVYNTRIILRILQAISHNRKPRNAEHVVENIAKDIPRLTK